MRRYGRAAVLAAAVVPALAIASALGWWLVRGDAGPSRGAAPPRPAEAVGLDPIAAAPLGSAESRAVPGLRVEVLDVVRVSAGVVEVRLALVNRSETAPLHVGTRLGDPEDGPGSLSGAYLTAGGGSRRYYVLRDAQGRPACSTDLAAIDARGRAPAWIRFPAPPEGEATVTLHLGDLVVDGLPIAPPSGADAGRGAPAQGVGSSGAADGERRRKDEGARGGNRPVAVLVSIRGLEGPRHTARGAATAPPASCRAPLRQRC